MTVARPRRINARLPADVASKVEYIERRRKKTTTEAVVESIEHYYSALVGEEGCSADLLMDSGFVGCASGPPDLSSTYKAELARSLAKKT